MLNSFHIFSSLRFVPTVTTLVSQTLHHILTLFFCFSLGYSPNTKAREIDMERQKSREMFEEYIKDVTSDFVNRSTNSSNNTTVLTSTPTNTTLDNTMAQLLMSPIKTQSETSDDTTLYKSLDQTQTIVNKDITTSIESTLYKSLDESGTDKQLKNTNPFEDSEDEAIADVERTDLKDQMEKKEEDHDDDDDHLKYVYSSTENEAERKLLISVQHLC